MWSMIKWCHPADKRLIDSYRNQSIDFLSYDDLYSWDNQRVVFFRNRFSIVIFSSYRNRFILKSKRNQIKDVSMESWVIEETFCLSRERYNFSDSRNSIIRHKIRKNHSLDHPSRSASCFLERVLIQSSMWTRICDQERFFLFQVGRNNQRKICIRMCNLNHKNFLFRAVRVVITNDQVQRFVKKIVSFLFVCYNWLYFTIFEMMHLQRK